MEVADKKKLNLQVFISSLLCEHCDFDELRAEGLGIVTLSYSFLFPQ